jgi:hypothetical protein
LSQNESRSEEIAELLREGGAPVDPARLERWIRLLREPTPSSEPGQEHANLASLHPGEAAWTDVREQELVARILERTTREDLTWRGELRLLRSFLRDRLARSRAWRLLAASVLAHFLAVPALAWFVWKETRPPRIVHIEFETTPDSSTVFADPEEEIIALEVPGILNDPLELEMGRARGDGVWNARRRDRYALSMDENRPSAPLAGLDEGLIGSASAEIGWLTARSQGLNEGRWEAGLDDTRRLDRVELAALVLHAEVLLDRLVQAGGRPGDDASVQAVLGELSLRQPPHSLETKGENQRRQRLRALVLDRARSYGVWPATKGFDPLSVPPAPNPEVLRLVVEETGRPLFQAHPVGRAWLDWATANQ